MSSRISAIEDTQLNIYAQVSGDADDWCVDNPKINEELRSLVIKHQSFQTDIKESLVKMSDSAKNKGLNFKFD